MLRKLFLSSFCAILIAVGALTFGAPRQFITWIGRQIDGSYLVSSGQRIEGDGIRMMGRPSDIALHPTDNVLAVLSQHEVTICTPHGILARSHTPLGNASASFHGILWTNDHRGSDWWPDAIRFLVSTDQGTLQQYCYSDMQLEPQGSIALDPDGSTANAWPGGMCMTKDRKTVFVAAAGLDSVVQVDLVTQKRVKAFPVQTLPYEVQLSSDEKTLIVSNWGGRKPLAGDEIGHSGDEPIVTDPRGVCSTGTVSFIDRATGDTTNVDVGIHPTSIIVSGDTAYVANAMSDTISVINVPSKTVTRVISVRRGDKGYIGAMPNAMAIDGNTLYICNGGDNAICEVDIPSGKILGYRHAGYYPSAIQLSHDGKTAYVLNTKGIGSVGNTMYGNPGSPHDFVGTISVVDLTKDLNAETAIVARDNHWGIDPQDDRPKLSVYNGAIKHVLYIIKENQTYDSIFGAFPKGNGDPSLCVLGHDVMPNHWALADQFTLFDNAYVSGTNSADGHAWCTQSMANDYMEHMYVSYRTYSDDGNCAMSRAEGGMIWDKVLAAHKTFRDYGEFCDSDTVDFKPYQPTTWFEAYDDYKSGGHKFTYTTTTQVDGLRPYICPDFDYWPLIESDQQRVGYWLKEYEHFSKTDTVPDLTVMCLPSDHSAGLDPAYPTPRSMRADNDLALGRVVEAVSHSPQWKDTCIFVTEDDGQALPDHVDGHRVPYMVISPYTKRHAVDSHFYTTTNMLRSIEMMLDVDPMNKFDALSVPITTCFNNTPDLTPYDHVPNIIPLGERNKPLGRMGSIEKMWYHKSIALNWSHNDAADPYWLSRITWFSLTGGKRPFPVTPGQPNQPRLQQQVMLAGKLSHAQRVAARDGDDDDDR
jgi:YVTN family beta-propeller protein